MRDMNNSAVSSDVCDLVTPLLLLCQEAGEAICAHYEAASAGEFEAKSDDSPLTQADIASHAILKAGLNTLDSTLPVLSEESPESEIATRRTWSRFWLVDPLDGTKEFLARTGEFTINIALVDQHRPVLGVVYLPLERTAYVGIPGKLAQRHRLLADELEIRELGTRPLTEGQGIEVLASRRHRGDQLRACLDWLAGQWDPVYRSNMGSALKFCRMAEGEGDFYPRFSPCSEWDTGAGQALVEAAGGKVVGLDGLPLRYNCDESLICPPFFAFADSSHPLWRQMLDRAVQ